MKESPSRKRKGEEKTKPKIRFEKAEDHENGTLSRSGDNYNNDDTMVSEFMNWQPVFDLFIAGEKLTVSIEVAGVKPSDIEIRIGKTHMIISGIRRPPVFYGKSSCIYHTMELPYGRFRRRIEFPLPVEPRAYHYCDDNGILTIVFPVIKERVIPVK